MSPFESNRKASSALNTRVRPRPQPDGTATPRLGVGQRLRQWWQAKGADPQPQLVDSDDDQIELVAEPTAAWVSWLTWGTAGLCVVIVALAALNLHDFQTRVETGVASKFDTFGTKRVTTQQVILASGVHWGHPLTTIDRDTVARNIEKLPWVRHADVEAQLPNRVIFHVQEYEPYALMLGDSKMMIVDASGHVFKQAELGEAGDLPVITGFSTQLHREAHVRTAYEQATPEQRRLLGVLRLIQGHAASSVAEVFPLSEVHYDPVLGTTLISARDGAEVRMGKGIGGDPERAFGLMARVVERARSDGEWLRYALLDDELRPERVVVRTEKSARNQTVVPYSAGGSALAELPKAATVAADESAILD